MKYKSFLFYTTFYEQLKKLHGFEVKKIIECLCLYVDIGQTIKLNKRSYEVFENIKKVIDLRHEINVNNGKKGNFIKNKRGLSQAKNKSSQA